MVRLLAWLRFAPLWLEPPSSAQIMCLICIPGLHNPWRYKDRRGLTPILMGKSRFTQLQSTALGIQAQGRTIRPDNGFDHCRSLLLSCPWLLPLKPSFPLCPAGQWGFLTPNSKLPQPGSIFVEGGHDPPCLFIYTCFLCLRLSWETHQWLVSKPLISYCDSVYTIRISPLLIQISTLIYVWETSILCCLPF